MAGEEIDDDDDDIPEDKKLTSKPAFQRFMIMVAGVMMNFITAIILLFFVGNSVGTITQRTQQLDFDSAYGDFFMTVATAVIFAVCLFVYLKSDKTDTKKILEGSWYVPILCGAFNFLQNLLTYSLLYLILLPIYFYNPLDQYYLENHHKTLLYHLF